MRSPSPPPPPNCRPNPFRTGAPAGRAFLIQVPGTWASALSDSVIAGLMNWLLPELTGRRDVAAFSTEEMGQADVTHSRTQAQHRGKKNKRRGIWTETEE